MAQVHDFDQLRIPFRAVAADIVTGEEVVLSKGDLATAIRASMSIPAVLAPVEIDGRLLVDGGVAANLPIDAVRAMGADIVIAVNVGSSGAAEIRGMVKRRCDCRPLWRANRADRLESRPAYLRERKSTCWFPCRDQPSQHRRT